MGRIVTPGKSRKRELHAAVETLESRRLLAVAASYSLVDLGLTSNSTFHPAGLNDTGLLVGTGLSDSSGFDVAKTFNGTSLVELGSLDDTSSSAEAINNNGIAAGQSSTDSGDQAVFFGNQPVPLFNP